MPGDYFPKQWTELSVMCHFRIRSTQHLSLPLLCVHSHIVTYYWSLRNYFRLASPTGKHYSHMHVSSWRWNIYFVNGINKQDKRQCKIAGGCNSVWVDSWLTNLTNTWPDLSTDWPQGRCGWGCRQGWWASGRWWWWAWTWWWACLGSCQSFLARPSLLLPAARSPAGPEGRNWGI